MVSTAATAAFTLPPTYNMQPLLGLGQSIIKNSTFGHRQDSNMSKDVYYEANLGPDLKWHGMFM